MGHRARAGGFQHGGERGRRAGEPLEQVERDGHFGLVEGERPALARAVLAVKAAPESRPAGRSRRGGTAGRAPAGESHGAEQRQFLLIEHRRGASPSSRLSQARRTPTHPGRPGTGSVRRGLKVRSETSDLVPLVEARQEGAGKDAGWGRGAGSARTDDCYTACSLA